MPKRKGFRQGILSSWGWYPWELHWNGGSYIFLEYGNLSADYHQGKFKKDPCTESLDDYYVPKIELPFAKQFWTSKAADRFTMIEVWADFLDEQGDDISLARSAWMRGIISEAKQTASI